MADNPPPPPLSSRFSLNVWQQMEWEANEYAADGNVYGDDDVEHHNRHRMQVLNKLIDELAARPIPVGMLDRLHIHGDFEGHNLDEDQKALLERMAPHFNELCKTCIFTPQHAAGTESLRVGYPFNAIFDHLEQHPLREGTWEEIYRDPAIEAEEEPDRPLWDFIFDCDSDLTKDFWHLVKLFQQHTE